MEKSRGRLLVVDDQEVITELLSAVFRDRGFDVDCARHGRDALAKAGQADLMLLDVMLPEMDGWEVLSALRRDPRTERLPVVMMSAAVDPVYPRRARQAAAHFLEKPFPLARLLEVVDGLIPPRDAVA